jgi:nitrous oxidase accessory protein NosD
VRIEDCHSHGHTGLGLHPGSGSQRSTIRNCRLEGNDIGIFFCWGVRFGTAEKNIIRGNRIGVSIGHRDTDNLVSENEIRDSREAGILFRKEKDASAAGHRNRIERNRLIDNGAEGGAAIDVAAPVRGVLIAGNVIRETRGGRRQPVRVAPEAVSVTVRDNTIEGFAVGGPGGRPAGHAPLSR